MYWLVTISYVTRHGNTLDQDALVKGTRQEILIIVLDRLRQIRNLIPVGISSFKIEETEWNLLRQKGCSEWTNNTGA